MENDKELIRTNIWLSRSTRNTCKLFGKLSGITMSNVIRNILDEHFKNIGVEENRLKEFIEVLKLDEKEVNNYDV